LIEIHKENNGIVVTGSLTYKTLPIFIETLNNFKKEISFLDFRKTEKIDTSSFIFIHDFSKLNNINKLIMTEEQQKLFEIVKEHIRQPQNIKDSKGIFYSIGKTTYEIIYEVYLFLDFIGEIFVNIAKSIINPKNIRIKATVNDIENMGIKAMPLITIISFLVGVVISYHGSVKLKQFGANIFIVDLVTISFIREFGPLIVAILLAGRSSSSYTAQIGIMKVTEEVDVIKIMGLNPFNVLVIPKIVSMIISLPILTVLADIMGILGGLILAYLSLDITPYDFISRLHHVANIKMIVAGMIKTPVFAFLIASIGSYKGFRTKKNVNSIGENVTISVVDSIFAVIIVDAVFSILFSWAGI